MSQLEGGSLKACLLCLSSVTQLSTCSVPSCVALGLLGLCWGTRQPALGYLPPGTLSPGHGAA